MAQGNRERPELLALLEGLKHDFSAIGARLTVQQQRDRALARPLVEIVHPQPVLLEVARFERVAGEVAEPIVGRAQRFHVSPCRDGSGTLSPGVQPASPMGQLTPVPPMPQ